MDKIAYDFNFQGQTALHAAATSEYVKAIIIKTLLKHGCKPDEMDNQVNQIGINFFIRKDFKKIESHNQYQLPALAYNVC